MILGQQKFLVASPELLTNITVLDPNMAIMFTQVSVSSQNTEMAGTLLFVLAKWYLGESAYF